MKKHYFVTGFQSLILLCIFLAAGLHANAQDILSQPIPVDPNIRIGTLPNGLKYYIRKNAKPEKRVELRLAVNAGSVLEDDDQQGLAHFVEHMAFNGTRNFEKNKLVKYLQSVGVKFGPEINAYTSFDETVYMLTLPTDSAHILKQGFQIMEDWAHNLLFDPAEIDKERGVIIEEWRLGRGPFQRMQDKYLPEIFKGSMYAERLPIGKKEIIEGAPYETLKRFYTEWYRPELMAFVVVGDIDVDEMELTVREHFGRIENPASPRERKRFSIPDQPGTSVMVLSDKESPYTLVQLIIRDEAREAKLNSDYREQVAERLVTAMLTQRLEELKEQADPPLLYSGVEYSQLGTREKNAFQVGALVSESGIERGLTAIISETERARRHGFTAGELERQKKQLLMMYESAYAEREKTESESFSSEYVRNFLTGEPIPGIEFEYNFVKEHLGGISIEEINTLTKRLIKNENRVIIAMAPEKEGLTLPTNDRLLSLIGETENGSIEAYVDKVTGESLMEELPKKGRIMLTKKNEALGVTEMTLANGARVILKPTDFKNDEILFRAYSPGGYSLYPVSDHPSASNASDVMGQMGVAGFSPADLAKLLAGKKLNANMSIGAYYETLTGSAAPADLESMLQLVYLGFTQPRSDSMLFESYKSKQKGVVKNLLADPENFFFDQYTRVRTQNHPRADVIPTEADIDKISLGRVTEIYRDRFSDASDFVFFFVGAFKTDSLKPLIETYLASLPSNRRKENWVDMGIRAPQAKVDQPVYKGADQKTILALYSETEMPWDAIQSYYLESLESLLDIRYIEVLREEMSGIYGMSVNLNLVRIPYPHLETVIYIPCSPENADKLTATALAEIEKIRTEGVKDEDLMKVKEGQRRDLEKNQKENGFWISSLVQIYQLADPEYVSRQAGLIESLTSENLKTAASAVDTKKYVRVVLYPEGYKK